MTDVPVIKPAINYADNSMLDLPDGILQMVEMMPMEDLLLALFARGLPQLEMHTLVPPSDYLSFPFVLARRAQPVGNWTGDPRFIDRGRVLLSVFTEDPDGENKGVLISEAIRIMFRQAWLEHWNFPGLGSIVQIKMMHEPGRVADWATATGPVQFADLPGNVWRTETSYEFIVRRPVK